MKSLMLALFCASFPLVTHAAEFDPSFIIEDHDLTAHTSMSRADVVDFLNTHNGQIARQFFRDVDGTQQSAADIIFRAALTHRISPRVLLVLLQKEQSLVTDPSPTLGQLNWAMGYAACDSCDVSRPEIAKNAGFANQVDAAAGAFRYYMNNRLSQAWIKRAGETYAIDGISVKPANDATGYFYTYTPHIEGNKNFWKIWQTWFEKAFPDGLVVKAHNDPDVWFIDNGMRRHIQSMNVLRSYFNESDIRRVDAADIAGIPIGEPMKFPNYALLHVNGRTFLLADNELLQFASDQALRDLGFNPLEVIVASQEETKGYAQGTMLTSASVYPTGALVKTRISGKIYYVKNGVKHPVTHEALLKTNFNNKPPILVKDTGFADFIEGTPVIFQDGAIIGLRNEQLIYLISHGERRLIPNEQTLTNLGFSLDDIHWVDDAAIMLHAEGNTL